MSSKKETSVCKYLANKGVAACEGTCDVLGNILIQMADFRSNHKGTIEPDTLYAVVYLIQHTRMRQKKQIFSLKIRFDRREMTVVGAFLEGGIFFA